MSVVEEPSAAPLGEAPQSAGGEEMEFEAPVPADMATIVSSCERAAGD